MLNFVCDVMQLFGDVLTRRPTVRAEQPGIETGIEINQNKTNIILNKVTICYDIAVIVW